MKSSSSHPAIGDDGAFSSLGRWHRERLIGSGGMADVYLATAEDERQAALKVIRSHGLRPWRRRLFERECDLLTRLDHPNIVRLLEHGQSADRLWIALQYVAGTSASNLRASRPEILTSATVAQITGYIASALDYAHGLSVVHRDVKPSNILVSIAADGSIERAVLSDFGIAKAVGISDVTYTDAITGTLGYAAPELLRSLPAVPASDQYSLACTVFALLTGRAPYVADSIAAQVHAQLTADPPHASRLTDSSPELDAVLMRAMSKNPADRYPSCAAFAAELATAVGIAHDDVPDTDNRPPRDLYESTIPPLNPRRRKRRVQIGVTGSLVAVVLAAVALVVVRTGGGAPDDLNAAQLQRSADELCQVVRTSSLDPGARTFQQVSDTRPEDAATVGRGCRFTAAVPGVRGVREFTIGFTPDRPDGTEPKDTTSSDADYKPYQRVERRGDQAQCLVGYRTKVGYLNVETSADSKECDNVMDSLTGLESLELTSPAHR